MAINKKKIAIVVLKAIILLLKITTVIAYIIEGLQALVKFLDKKEDKRLITEDTIINSNE